MSLRDEAYLIKRFQAGDNAAFKTIYEEINPRLLGWLSKSFMLGEWGQEAEDICAEAWTKVYHSRARFTAVEHVKRFIYVIAKNLAIDRYRLKPKEKEFKKAMLWLSSEQDDFQETLDSEIALQNVEAALEQIGGNTAEALKMYVFRNMSTPEVADALGVARQTALNLKTRAIDLLKKILVQGITPRYHPKHRIEVGKPSTVAQAKPEIVKAEEKPVQTVVEYRRSTWTYEVHIGQLMEQFRQGDKEAFRYVYDLCNGKFWAFALTLEAHEPPEDIVAELWYKIFHRRQHFNDPNHVRRYGYVFLRHYEINMKIAKAKERQSMATMEWTPCDDHLECWNNQLNWEQLASEIREILNRLQLAGGKVLEMQFFRDMEMPEIAARLGIGLKAAYKNRSLALEKLKIELQPYKSYLICQTN